MRPLRSTRRRLVAAVTAVALVGGACGSSSGSDSLVDTPSIDPFTIAPSDGQVVRALTADVDIRVSGAIEATYQGPSPIQVITQVGAGIPESAWLLLIGVLDPLETSSGHQVRPAVDLTAYRGDGDYTIRPRGGGDVEPLDTDAEGNAVQDQIGGALESAALMAIGGNGLELAAYPDLLEPCSLEVADMGERGSISCPRVAGPDGAEMAFSWSWQATGALQQLESDAQGQPVEAAPDPVERPDAAPPTAPGGEGSASPGDPAPEPEPMAPLDLAVDMSTDCWQRGQEVVITITTEPQAALAMLIAYEDARTYGQQRLGTTDAEGRFIWRVIPATDAPDGEGNFLVSASSSDGRRGNSDSRTFELQLLCE